MIYIPCQSLAKLMPDVIWDSGWLGLALWCHCMPIAATATQSVQYLELAPGPVALEMNAELLWLVALSAASLDSHMNTKSHTHKRSQVMATVLANPSPKEHQA